MSFSVRRVFLLSIAIGFGVGLTWFLLFHYRLGPYQPLQEAHDWKFPSVDLSKVDQERFIDGEFVRITEVKLFPPALRRNYLELNGTRFTMADPGKPFQATDVILDASLPRKRLLFAGRDGEKCFIHYEQGGIGRSYLIAFFEAKSDERAEPIWLGYCGREAADLADLKTMLHTGECRSMLQMENEAIKKYSSDSSKH